jgi:hypothetical protein
LNHSSGTRAAANDIVLHICVCLLICLSATHAAANEGFFRLVVPKLVVPKNLYAFFHVHVCVRGKGWRRLVTRKKTGGEVARAVSGRSLGHGGG